MYDQVIKALVASKAHKATKFISEREVIRAVRTKYRYNNRFDNSKLEITLTHGRPNYLEREFIKACKKAGEPFPVKKVQLKFLSTNTRKNLKKRR